MKKFKAFTLIETLIVIVVFCIGILTVLYGLSQTLRNKEYANTQIQSAFFAREGIEMIFNIRDANYHKELPWNCIFKPKSTSKFSIELDDNGNEINNSVCDGYLNPGNVLKVDMGDKGEYINVKLEGEKKNNSCPMLNVIQNYILSEEGYNKEYDLNDDGEVDGSDLQWKSNDCYAKSDGNAWDLSKDENFDKIFENYQIYKHTNGDTFEYNHDSKDGEATGFARFIVIKSVDSKGGELDKDKLLKIESHVLYKKGIFKGEKVMETFIGNYEFNQ